MIGRAQACIEDQVEVGAGGCRLLQGTHRTAGQQLVEGEQTRLARMGDVRHDTIYRQYANACHSHFVRLPDRALARGRGRQGAQAK